MRAIWRQVGALTLTAVFWGLAPVANRYLVGQMRPWDLLVIRLVIAALLFTPLLGRLRRDRWPPGDLLLLFLGGAAAVAGYYVPVTVGAQWISAGAAGLLLTAEPVWLLLLSMLVLRERQPWPVIAGLLLAGSGVALLIGWHPGGAGGGALFAAGAGLTVFAGLMWAVYSLLLAPLGRRHGALAGAGLTTMAGTLLLLPFAGGPLLHTAPALPPLHWGGLLLLAVGATFLGTLLWTYGLTKVSAARAGLFLYLQPLISVLGGVLLLHEAMQLRTLLSGAMIVGGVALAQAPAPAPPPRQAAAGP